MTAAGAEFVCTDVSAPDLVARLGTPRADLALTMETIEHLEDYFTFVESCAALVGTDGVVVVGTPNRGMTYERYPGRRHMDPSHVQEFTAIALRQTLARVFGSVELFQQCVPGHWDPAASPPSAPLPPARPRRIVRSLTPPAFWSVRSRLRPDPPPTVERRYSADDISIVDYTPTEDTTAFALIAVCRQPI